MSNPPREVEALVWLNQDDGKKRGISESSYEEIVGDDLKRIVLEFYDAGAKKVIVFGVGAPGEDWEDGNGLIIHLPHDDEHRAKIFAIQNRVNAEMDTCYDPDTDKGQDITALAW